MINEASERLTLEENVKLIRDIFFGKQTSELRLVDLKSIEVSNRDGHEDEEKNDELAEIFENLLDYCLKGITPQDLVNLNDIDVAKKNGGHKVMEQFSKRDEREKNLNEPQRIINKYRNVSGQLSYSEAELKKKKMISDIVQTDSFAERINSLITIAFYANKAEKMRIANYKREIQRNNGILPQNQNVLRAYKKILYSIKQECVRQAIIALTTDPNAQYKEDEKGMPIGSTFNWAIDDDVELNRKYNIAADKKERYYIFRFLDETQIIPFSFHIPPQECKTFSEDLKDKIYAGNYSIDKIRDQRIVAAMEQLCGKQLIEENIALKSTDRKIVQEVRKKLRLKKVSRKRCKGNNKEKMDRMRNEFALIDYLLSKSMGVFYGNLKMGKQEQRIDIDLETQPGEARREQEAIINDVKIRNGVVVTQYGKNLDLHAIVATLQYYFDKHEPQLGMTIRRKMIDAGKESDEHLTIDAGKLDGNKNVNDKNKATVINADQRRGERSSVSILAKDGFYVPRMIVKYADTVISDERALDPFNGCVLSREVPINKLFEYAEEKDPSTKKYLMESSLKEEQLKRYGLYDFAMKRKSDIQQTIERIAQNSYCIEQNGTKIKVAVVPDFLYNGSIIAYALGYDAYISITPYKGESSKSTFSITLNPNAKYLNGQKLLISEDTVSSLNKKISVFDRDESTGIKHKKIIFVLPNRTLAIVGGKKSPGLYADKGASEIRDMFTSKLTRDEEQSQLVEEKLREIRAKNKGITGREIFETSKSAIKYPELLEQAQKAIHGDIERQSGKIVK